MLVNNEAWECLTAADDKEIGSCSLSVSINDNRILSNGSYQERQLIPFFSVDRLKTNIPYFWRLVEQRQDNIWNDSHWTKIPLLKNTEVLRTLSISFEVRFFSFLFLLFFSWKKAFHAIAKRSPCFHKADILVERE